MWLEQQEQATLQTKKEERLATLQSEKAVREAAYAHSKRLEIEKLAFTSGRYAENQGSGFDLGRARRFMPVFEEDAVDFFSSLRKWPKRVSGPSKNGLSLYRV